MMVPGWIRHPTTPQEAQVKLEHSLDHIDHICQLAGNARHCGIGSDLDGAFGLEQSPLDIDTIADLRDYLPLLERRGYSQADIEGIMHGNWIRFLRDAWADRKGEKQTRNEETTDWNHKDTETRSRDEGNGPRKRQKGISICLVAEDLRANLLPFVFSCAVRRDFFRCRSRSLRFPYSFFSVSPCLCAFVVPCSPAFHACPGSGASMPRAVARSVRCSCSCTMISRKTSLRANSPNSSAWRIRVR